MSKRVHAVLPLALLEAVKNIDLPTHGRHDEYHEELTSKRFGLSPTVAAQIERYDRMAARHQRVNDDELTALLRLVERRPDAALVFSEAGRLAAARALRGKRSRVLQRAIRIPSGLGRTVGFRLARSVADDFLAVDLTRDGEALQATLNSGVTVLATPKGSTCGFFGSAVAELLRTCTTFDGAMLHTQCRSRGEEACTWRSREE